MAKWSEWKNVDGVSEINNTIYTGYGPCYKQFSLNGYSSVLSDNITKSGPRSFIETPHETDFVLTVTNGEAAQSIQIYSYDGSGTGTNLLSTSYVTLAANEVRTFRLSDCSNAIGIATYFYGNENTNASVYISITE